MSTIQRAVLVRAYGGADAAQVAEIEKPEPAQGPVLVRVRAAGVNGIDWTVREGNVRNAFPLPLPIVLGAEMAGVVDAVGPGASRFRVGDRVMSAVQNHVAELERALSSPNVVPLGQAKKNQ